MIEPPKQTISPWILWGMGSLFFLYQFVVRVSPAVMADDWLLWFSIDTAMLGSVVSLYYVSYSSMQVPLGLLFDKYGPRALMTTAALVIALGCTLTMISHSLILFSIGRFIIGLGSACGFLGTLKIATLCFPEERLSLIAGLTTAIGTFGGIVGGAPLSFLTEFIGWRGSFLILAAIGLFISILAFSMLRFLPKPKKVRFKTASHAFHDMLVGLRIVMRKSYTWRVALFAFCMYTPLSAFADFWGVPFFKDSFGYDEIYAASLTGTVFLGVIAGGVLLGGMIRVWGKHNSMVLGATTAVVTFSLILFAPLSEPLLYGTLFLQGMAFAPECIAFSLIYSVLPNGRGGIAVGFTNMVAMTSGVLLQPIIGWVLEFSSFSQGLERYQLALSTILVCLVGAFVLALSLRPKKYPLVSRLAHK